jgi:hypothetical protein
MAVDQKVLATVMTVSEGASQRLAGASYTAYRKAADADGGPRALRYNEIDDGPAKQPRNHSSALRRQP